MLRKTLKLAQKYGWNLAIKALLFSLLNLSGRIIDEHLYASRLSPKNIYIVKFGGLNIPAYLAKVSLKSLGEPVETHLLVAAFDSGLSKDILMYGVREPLHTLMLYQIIKKGGFTTILDLGSNIGYFPKIELVAGAEEIIAFEPIPHTYAILRENLKECNRCITINAAVAKSEGNSLIYVPVDVRGLPILNLASMNKEPLLKDPRVAYIHTYNVQSMSFQKILDKHAPDIIRMDIEGYEWELFTSLYRIPPETKIIDFEVHGGNIRKAKQSLLFLKEEGFLRVIVVVDPNILNFWIRFAAKPLHLESALKIYNRLLLSTIPKGHVYDGTPILKTKLTGIINNLNILLSLSGFIHLILKREK